MWTTRLALNIATAILGNLEDAVACVLEAQEQLATARLASVRAHVRTGTYSGTVERRIRGLQREMPRAETLCGGEPTSKDHNRAAAAQTIRDRAEPWYSDMCPACRAQLEGAGARDLSHLPGRSGTATGPQLNYLRALCHEGFAARYPVPNRHAVDRMSAREASATIDTLKAAKAKGWIP
jgi:hypothetical protein